jgi:DNA-binding HxlR family transcriptional regulator
MDKMEEKKDIQGTVTCDVWEALKKFANANINQVAQTLLTQGPLTLGEIREETGLSTNVLNHNLIEMRRVDLVKKIGPKYYITKYGAVLFEGLDEVLEKLYPISKETLLEPQELKASS